MLSASLLSRQMTTPSCRCTASKNFPRSPTSSKDILPSTTVNMTLVERVLRTNQGFLDYSISNSSNLVNMTAIVRTVQYNNCIVCIISRSLKCALCRVSITSSAYFQRHTFHAAFFLGSETFFGRLEQNIRLWFLFSLCLARQRSDYDWWKRTYVYQRTTVSPPFLRTSRSGMSYVVWKLVRLDHHWSCTDSEKCSHKELINCQLNGLPSKARSNYVYSMVSY